MGAWTSIEHMESSITLDELYFYVDKLRDAEYQKQKFAAALKGIDLDEGRNNTESFDAVKQKADAALAGKSEEEHVFDIIGIEFEDDDE